MTWTERKLSGDRKLRCDRELSGDRKPRRARKLHADHKDQVNGRDRGDRQGRASVAGRRPSPRSSC
ncbi:hypothetical protein Sliba_30900 [Streptomyces nigrescens]|uniref:Uncharacterized protein n=1 Tax=Streptomyces nigrescens TaxID=1920 RepID=A0A640TGA4_STRNI|nr:hypothetical protein Sliba_30900 [Streptomyces libani subsp. libani]GGV91441.1 hypothetical protein GCM10010500_21700 [Streptomyces libani subsp. libani]